MSVVTAPQASAAVGELGWRYVLGTLRASLRLGPMWQGAEVATELVRACGVGADESLRIDLRSGRLELVLQSARSAAVTAAELDLARQIATTAGEMGLRLEPCAGGGRSVQALEVGIDARDAARIRPFWKAVLGYAGEGGADGPVDPIADPLAQAPAVSFRRTGPRPQHNRIHLDVCVPHDEAPGRIRAALEAGGTLLSDSRAPACWVLADAEGNEVRVSTWQGRD
ncbi:VOC family protein [Actinoplanes sp. NPDC049118]|uniref:VOC family protein n=1 Tax=Actinoplanes sp. NPDC049118 TaxID=3155769 RepID=UPI0034012D9C